MRAGILGGTFDPIHLGHTYLAQRVLEIFRLDRILLMVSREPPHKKARELTTGFHRFAMTALATRNHPRLLPCDWELQGSASSYTIDMLDRLRQMEPDARVCFIAGSDSLREIRLWKDCGRLLREHCFVFVQRPGETVNLSELELPADLRERIRRVDRSDPPDIVPGASCLITLDAPDVSSSSIRHQIAAGIVPPESPLDHKVQAYIAKFQLYERH